MRVKEVVGDRAWILREMDMDMTARRRKIGRMSECGSTGGEWTHRSYRSFATLNPFAAMSCTGVAGDGEGALDMVDRDSERAGTGERVNGADETDNAAGLPTTREANALELADRGDSRAGDDAHRKDRDAYDLDRGGKILETDALVMLLCRVEIGVSRVSARSTRIDASAAG